MALETLRYPRLNRNTQKYRHEKMSYTTAFLAIFVARYAHISIFRAVSSQYEPIPLPADLTATPKDVVTIVILRILASKPSKRKMEKAGLVRTLKTVLNNSPAAIILVTIHKEYE